MSCQHYSVESSTLLSHICSSQVYCFRTHLESIYCTVLSHCKVLPPVLSSYQPVRALGLLSCFCFVLALSKLVIFLLVLVYGDNPWNNCLRSLDFKFLTFILSLSISLSPSIVRFRQLKFSNCLLDSSYRRPTVLTM